jgi:hypothetical protein
MATCLASAGTGGKTEGKDQSNAGAAFEKLKALTGHWEAASEKGKVTSSWEPVSNGTAMLEKINVGSEGEMVTVYYLDGGRLVLTHYCTAGNQPHMQAETFNASSNRIKFDFAGAGNLASSSDGHMHTAQFTFAGPDAFNADWTFYKDGKPAFTEAIQFHRVR